MSLKKSRIRHDYKSAGQLDPEKSKNRFTPSRHGRWFMLGAVVPLVLLSVALGTAGPRESVQASIASESNADISPAEVNAASLADVVAATTHTRKDTRKTSSAPIVLKLPEPKPDVFNQTPLDQVNENLTTLTVQSGDTLDELFLKNDLSRGDLGQILKIKEARQALSMLRPGDTVRVAHTDGVVSELRRELDEVRTLKVLRDSEADVGFVTRVIEKPVEIRMQHAKGQIDSSLFLSARDAGITDTLIMNLAGIFAWDIDFVLDIRRGDSFTMVYEEIWQDGHFVRNGEILAAEFQNDGDTFRAVRYADPDGNTGYFTPEGLNVKKAFLRAPIAFTPRVTSNFNPRRRHPVHKKVRPHRGVDYGAPKGTPIKAAGDGKVIFRGRKGGYGNVVILQHGGNITTLYAHMSKFARKARNGSRVKQGQVIGYVGRTGTATGNHLHYEYRVSGVHRNPRTVKLPQALPVPKKYKTDFVASTKPLINHLTAVAKTQRLASND